MIEKRRSSEEEAVLIAISHAGRPYVEFKKRQKTKIKEQIVHGLPVFNRAHPSQFRAVDLGRFELRSG